MSVADSTSIGTGAEITVRSSPRVPVIATVSRLVAAFCNVKFAVVVEPFVTVTDSAAGDVAQQSRAHLVSPRGK